MKKNICILLLSFLFQTAISQNKEIFRNKIGFSFNVNYLFLGKVKVQNTFYDSIISKVKPGYILSANLDYKILKNLKIEAGMGFTQRAYSYLDNILCNTTFIKGFDQNIKILYIQVPLTLIYERRLNNKINAIGTLSLCENIFRKFQNKTSNDTAFNIFFVSYNNNFNFNSIALNLGINYKITENLRLPLTISFEKNNNKYIGFNMRQGLMINSFILGIKTGIYFN